MELVSIIMPVKNTAQYLGDCLESILKQSYQDWELIAVDDHSSDTSKNILIEYARKDQRINVLDNAGNGIIDALKTAFKYAKGIYLTRMDADDIIPDDRLEKMVKNSG